MVLLLASSSVPPAIVETAGGDECPRAADPTFVGADSCKKCHFKQFQGWKKTKMAMAFDSLKPDKAVEAKTKFSLDPKKDYTKDPKCVECHTTGYGKAGGYPAIVEGKTWTEDETKRATAMENVQCESCHGPASLTNEHKKTNEQYKKDDLVKMGLVAPDEANCKSCHNEKSPTVPKDYKFDYKELTKDPEKVHPHVPLVHKH
jgi:hypothetical protein